MDFNNLSDENIDEQIELFKDRIETISDHISESEDNIVRSVLVSRRNDYRFTLEFLFDEKRKRYSRKIIIEKSEDDIIEPIECENCDCVKIGNQVWMTSNLDVSHFNNGDIIPEVQSNEDWIKAGKNFEPAWCYYDNNNSYSKYGKLYNLYAVSDSRGIAPKGYHVAEHDEWRELGKYSSKKLKSNFGWDDNGIGNGTNETGFNALPGGDRDSNGSFSSIGTSAHWWSMGLKDKKMIYMNPHWYIYNTRDDLDWFGLDSCIGFSVRCLKN